MNTPQMLAAEWLSDHRLDLSLTGDLAALIVPGCEPNEPAEREAASFYAKAFVKKATEHGDIVQHYEQMLFEIEHSPTRWRENTRRRFA